MNVLGLIAAGLLMVSILILGFALFLSEGRRRMK